MTLRAVSFVPRSIGAFRIIILLRNEILFIAFLVLHYQGY